MINSGLLMDSLAIVGGNRRIGRINMWPRSWCGDRVHMFGPLGSLEADVTCNRDGSHLNRRNSNILVGRFASITQEGFNKNGRGLGARAAGQEIVGLMRKCKL